MNRVHLSLVGLLLLIAVAGACKKESSEPNSVKAGSQPSATPAPSAHADEEEHSALPRKVRLPASVVADAKIKTAPVQRELLAATLALPGEIAADPDRSARLSTPVPGRLVHVSFKEGAVVKKGDVLALVRIPELAKLRAANAATGAKAASARANAGRLEALLAKGLTSTQEAMSAKADADALDAETGALAEQIRVLGIGAGDARGGSELALRAPLSGTVVARSAIVGQPVSADETIATITDLSEVWFVGRVFEKDLRRLREGARADVELNAQPDEHFAGSVEYIGQQIDPSARTVTARIPLTNRDKLLRIGLFGTARVATGETEKRAPTLVVPLTAIVEIAGKQVVFVRHADGDYEIHDVVLGESALGKIEIASGLREGELVVVEGAFTLKSVVLKSTLTEEE